MELLDPGLTQGAGPLCPFLHPVERTPVVAHLLFGLAALTTSGGNGHAHGLVIEGIALDAGAAAGAALIGRVTQPQAFVSRKWQQLHPRPGIRHGAEIVHQRIAVAVTRPPGRWG